MTSEALPTGLEMRSERLLILGTGRQGRNILDVCLDLGLQVVGFLDDARPAAERVNGVPVVGRFDQWRTIAAREDCRLIVGVGWNDARVQISHEILAGGGALATVIHPSCHISPFAEIGAGVFISSCSRILANARVGDFCLIEGHTTIGADSVLGDGVGAGPGVMLAGATRVGPGSFLGAGATVVRQATIGAQSVVAAGATVIGDVPDGVMVAGTPAVVKKKLAGPAGPP